MKIDKTAFFACTLIFTSCSKIEKVGSTPITTFRLPANEADYGKIGQCLLGNVEVQGRYYKGNFYKLTDGFRNEEPLKFSSFIDNGCPKGTQVVSPGAVVPQKMFKSDHDLALTLEDATVWFNCYGPCSALMPGP